jgi:hypothetical protein
MTSIANIGPESVPIPWRDGHGAIGVLEARDDHWPIAMAPGTGWDDPGRLLYRLTVRGAELPGRWVVVDREFRPAG